MLKRRPALGEVIDAECAAALTRLYPRREVAAPVVEAAFEAGRRAPGSAGHRAARQFLAASPRRPRGSRSRSAADGRRGRMALALLAVVVRSTDVLAGIDTSAAEWGNRHASPWTHDGLTLVTYLGETVTVIVWR